MEKIGLTIGLILLICISSYGDDLSLQLAKHVLIEADRIISDGGGDNDTGYQHQPPEILAFNLIYRTTNPAYHFKEIYRTSGTKGKFYSIIGLYYLKDKEYKKFEADFIHTQHDTVTCQYGCKVVTGETPQWLLKEWLDAIEKNIWFTKIILSDTAIKNLRYFPGGG